MLGFHSISEAPISSLLVTLILNGDIYLAALNINKEIDLNNYINISANIGININKNIEQELSLNLLKSSDAYTNITTEFIVSR
jgi:hypothetical protein